MSIRKMTVAGQFYPNDTKKIQEMFTHYNKFLDENLKYEKLPQLKPRAIIVPHAGYVYSAFTANIAFRLLKNIHINRVIVIGPSHRAYLTGTSISDYDEYQTPLGNLPIDKKFVEVLKDKFGLKFIPDAHHEHSTEVQMPFIKTYAKQASVVELVYGDENPQHLAKIINYILEDKDCVVVVSTDLSHYYNIDKANKIDSTCINAVQNLNIKELRKDCEACGKIGIEAMLIVAKEENLKSTILDYRTSGDASGDEDRVVGYMSAAFVE